MHRGFVFAVVGCVGVVAGWFAHDFMADPACGLTAGGYGRLDVNVHTLPEFPLENVSSEVIGEVQRCWAAHPYDGPQHSIALVGARRAAGDGYYLLFEPRGITDIQLVYSVDANRRVTGAYQVSMF